MRKNLQPYDLLSTHCVDTAKFAESEVEGHPTEHILTGLWERHPEQLVRVMAALLKDAALALRDKGG